MSAISSLPYLPEYRAVKGTVALHDVGDCVKSWGMRGILLGGLFGFALGAVFVAIPLASDVLTFGAIGTLIVGAVECAAIAGAFGAFAAAIFAKGVLRGNTTPFERSLTAGHRSSYAARREESSLVPEWPTRWAYPGLTTIRSILPADDADGIAVDHSWRNVQARLNTVAAWENGNTGP